MYKRSYEAQSGADELGQRRAISDLVKERKSLPVLGQQSEG
jgi:hypothetical protein